MNRSALPHALPASLLCLVASLSPLLAEDVTWLGSVGDWDTGSNWDNGTGPIAGDVVYIEAGTVNVDDVPEENVRAFRLDSGANLNFIDGRFRATAQSSWASYANGSVTQSGGEVDINELEVGEDEDANNGLYTLQGGSLNIARGLGSPSLSLYVGASRSSSSTAGTGHFEISGGSLITRRGVRLGRPNLAGIGRFSVLGSDITEIGIAASNGDGDGSWVQEAGSTLAVGIDLGGMRTIVLHDSDEDTDGTLATFASGSILDVGYHNITEGGGTWTVMEVQNGDIIDNGLAFASGVDQSIWSFTIDNSGANGRLLLTAIGPPLGLSVVIGDTPQQQMRYGMDYERLWYWTGGLNSSERDDIARWSAVDTDIDFIRVAMNSKYELTEGDFDSSAYDSKILPMMREMQDANPNLKYFASPRPLDEAVSGVAWQPYPQWVTGSTGSSSNFDFDWENCAQYIENYLTLMKSEGFKIDFLDISNEWQTTASSGTRITTGDMRDITERLQDNLDPADMPLIVGPSAWNYAQGASWIDQMTSQRRRDALAIASSHNTDRTGDAADFAQTVRDVMGDDTEIWNTEVHGWKSTSSQNETTSFFYYLEAVRAGFSGLNGWLAIGTRNQGHSYLLNPSGTPSRNVKYHIFQKFSSTSNYGHALEILSEPDVFADKSNDYDNPRSIAAFIKGNLMTVWVINENPGAVSINISPDGHTIATPTVRRTHWIDPDDEEGFEEFLPVTGNIAVFSTIPGESVSCFEIVLDGVDFATRRIEAEAFSHESGTSTETTGDVDGVENVGFISDGDFLRYGEVALEENSRANFRVARANGRPDGFIRIREGDSEGPILGEVDVPTTGNWQSYQTIETDLVNEAGIYNLYLEFVEDGTSNNPFVNINWFSVNELDEAPPVTGLAANAVGPTRIDLTWNAATGADTYSLLRSTSASGPFIAIANNLTGTTYADTGVSGGVQYHYLIRAIASGVIGPDSTPVASLTPPFAPTNVQAVAEGATGIRVSWNAVAGSTSYLVARSTTLGGPHTNIGLIPGNTTFLDPTPVPGVRYYYTVTANNLAGASPSSAEVNAFTYEDIVPANLVVESVTMLPNGASNATLSLAMPNTGLGQTYQLMSSTDLQPNSWQPAGPHFPGNGGLLIFNAAIDFNASTRRYFRVEVSIQAP